MAFKSEAQRRYVRRVAIAVTCYAVALAAALRFVPTGQVTGPIAYLLGALPGLALIGVFWANLQLLIEETDEYQRLLLVRQTLVAAGFALSVTTVWGFLENVGLAPQVDGFYVAVLFFIGLGVGGLYNRMTMGGDGDCP